MENGTLVSLKNIAWFHPFFIHFTLSLHLNLAKSVMAQNELKPWTMLPKDHRYTFFAQYKVKKFKIVKKIDFLTFYWYVTKCKCK